MIQKMTTGNPELFKKKLPEVYYHPQKHQNYYEYVQDTGMYKIHLTRLNKRRVRSI